VTCGWGVAGSRGDWDLSLLLVLAFSPYLLIEGLEKFGVSREKDAIVYTSHGKRRRSDS
jgi:hypothetical protein